MDVEMFNDGIRGLKTTLVVRKLQSVEALSTQEKMPGQELALLRVFIGKRAV
jgi:hypothetical protein